MADSATRECERCGRPAPIQVTLHLDKHLLTDIAYKNQCRLSEVVSENAVELEVDTAENY